MEWPADRLLVQLSISPLNCKKNLGKVEERRADAAAPCELWPAACSEACFASHESDSVRLRLVQQIILAYILLDFIEWIGYYSSKPMNGKGFWSGLQ